MLASRKVCYHATLNGCVSWGGLPSSSYLPLLALCLLTLHCCTADLVLPLHCCTADLFKQACLSTPLELAFSCTSSSVWPATIDTSDLPCFVHVGMAAAKSTISKRTQH